MSADDGKDSIGLGSQVLAFGELLWDDLPTGKVLGGAPANFAYHVALLGLPVILVSAVGQDEAGEAARRQLADWGVSTAHIATTPGYPTGSVNVQLSSSGQPVYAIARRVAWDFIEPTDAMHRAVGTARAICFGTLAQRSAVSRDCLVGLFKSARPDCCRVYDINLRAPFCEASIIKSSIQRANILKLNDEELPTVAKILGINGAAKPLHEICRAYSLKMVALTRGSAGSVLVTSDRMSERPAAPIAICDTIGAGDAFTAGLVAGLLAGADLDAIHELAAALASYVCTQRGGTPPPGRPHRDWPLHHLD
jgi:fructokinase